MTDSQETTEFAPCHIYCMPPGTVLGTGTLNIHIKQISPKSVFNSRSTLNPEVTSKRDPQMPKPLLSINRCSSANLWSAAQSPVLPATVVAQETARPPLGRPDTKPSIRQPSFGSLSSGQVPALAHFSCPNGDGLPPATKQTNKVVYISHNQQTLAEKIKS